MADFLAFFGKYLPVLLEGTLITLKLTAIGLGLGFVIGLPVAVARVYGGKWIGGFANAYISLFRGTPALVQLFVIYFGLPDIGLTLSRLTAAYLALGLNSAAYQAEYFRGAIQAISHGQMMAARSIGLSRLKAIRYVIMPQAFRFAIPAWSNEAVSMIKISSIVYLIAVPEMLYVAKELMAKYFNPFQTYFTVGAVYLIIIGSITLLLGQVEKKLAIPGLEISTRGN